MLMKSGMIELPKSSKPIICICGSRDIKNINLDLFIDPDHVGCVVSGGASGIDTLAESWAKKNKIEFIAYLAQWNKFGKKAGIIRNHEMVEFCDYVFAFWNGKSKGTLDTITYAKKLGVPTFIHLIEEMD